jgi:F0F1-type ATP synthase assembly protein I
MRVARPDCETVPKRWYIRAPMSQGDPSDGGTPPAGGDPWGITATLLSGMIVWGGVGWLADRWLGTSFLTLIGLLVGTGAAFYVIYLRTRG